MTRQIKHTFILALLAFLFVKCDRMNEQDKYKAPDWLAGKIYTQLATFPDLSEFTQCLEITGYDTILNVSGSYTVFAPNNDAFQQWYQEHPEYGQSLENVPLADLNDLVERHIIQNAWSSKQLRSLDIEGWIDDSDPNNNVPGGFKRQTIRENDNKKYFVNNNDEIVDSVGANSYKRVFTSSRKYAALFYDEYLSINGLTASDYDFYYDRSFESGAIYYRNAKLVDDEIFAENGFIYKIDEVTPILYNAEEILNLNRDAYSKFRSLINARSEFDYNEEETNLQPEVSAGQNYDNLFDLSFNGMTFYLHEELTGPEINSANSNNSVRYHYGLLAPSNQALQNLFNNVVTNASGYPHWFSENEIPDDVMLMILNAHMAKSPVYESSLTRGFENAIGDMVKVAPASVEDKFFCSNSSFIGLNEAIVPRAFSSVTGPIYLRPGYSVMRQAINYTNLLTPLKKENKAYSFYVISDEKFSEDSTLFAENSGNSFWAFNRSDMSKSTISRINLTNMLLNHVGTRLPNGGARKEFIENLAGNYIVVNNEDQTITGGIDSKYGYLGDSVISTQSIQLEEIADNGRTYEIRGWLSFPSSSMYSQLMKYPHFVQLIKDADLFDEVYNDFEFLTDKEFYTILMPNQEALAKLNTDTLTILQKQQLVKNHFIRGERILTDGSLFGGTFKTLSLDKTSTEYNTKFVELQIETGYDVIKVYNDRGELYCEINEQEGRTNQMISSQLNGTSGTSYDYAVTSVMHEIDTVLINY